MLLTNHRCTICPGNVLLATGDCPHVYDDDDQVVMSHNAWAKLVEELRVLRNLEAAIEDDADAMEVRRAGVYGAAAGEKDAALDRGIRTPLGTEIATALIEHHVPAPVPGVDEIEMSGMFDWEVLQQIGIRAAVVADAWYADEALMAARDGTREASYDRGYVKAYEELLKLFRDEDFVRRATPFIFASVNRGRRWDDSVPDDQELWLSHVRKYLIGLAEALRTETVSD